MSQPGFTDWQPACTREVLQIRAKMLAEIRRFFDERGVLEVETPLLSRASITDPHLIPFTTTFNLAGRQSGTALYLQTSPEFAMKRLLASGSGSIYQICKAFRNEETGRHHNPEFTLLEWYRVNWSLPRLIDEVDLLLRRLCSPYRQLAESEVVDYAEIFEQRVGVHPLQSSIAEMAIAARALGFSEAPGLCGDDRLAWLDFLFSHAVQPNLGAGQLAYITKFPACLPSLARRCPDDPDTVERVEVFLDGLELGNGFFELADADEQNQRFDHDLAERLRMGLPPTPKDERLLDALRAGLPSCSGIAVGLDRLLMLMTGRESIGDILAFPIRSA